MAGHPFQHLYLSLSNSPEKKINSSGKNGALITLEQLYAT